MDDQEHEGEGRPPSPRPPLEVPPLWGWWLVFAGLVVAMLFLLTDHVLRATASLSGTLLLAAAIRVVVHPELAGGVVNRTKGIDTACFVLLGVLVLVSGFALDLSPQ